MTLQKSPPTIPDYFTTNHIIHKKNKKRANEIKAVSLQIRKTNHNWTLSGKTN